MSWIFLIISFLIALFLSCNNIMKPIISSQFAIFFYYLTLLLFINNVAKNWLLYFAIVFTVGYIINLLVNIIEIYNKKFDISIEKNEKLLAKTMLQFSLSLILLMIVIVLLIK